MKRYPKGMSWSGIRLGSGILLPTLFLLSLTACAAHYPLNLLLDTTAPSWEEPTRYDRFYDAVEQEEPLIVILAFSGGGTRAASLAYGTLEALKRVEHITKPAAPLSSGDAAPVTMLDHVSLITAVSGGSFTAAYYGLHGDGIFEDFRERFLVRDVQGDLAGMLLNPLRWPRLASPRFGRSELAQEYYDSILFDGATLMDMTGNDKPAISILATDLVEGLAFPFVPDAFDLICSDFSAFPVARAVAASAAFPGAFSPIVMKNYSGHCHAGTPRWIEEALKKPDPRSREYQLARRASVYLDREEKPYLYLLDGGVSDNLGLRTVINKIMFTGGIGQIVAESQWKQTPRIAFIIVDAETQKRPSWHTMGKIPGIRSILGLSSTVIINKYNFETIDLLYRTIHGWRQQHEAASHAPEFYLVHMTFTSIEDPEERTYFNTIPTTLSLMPEQVDQIRDIAARLLYSDPEFKRLLADTGLRIRDDDFAGRRQTAIPDLSRQ